MCFVYVITNIVEIMKMCLVYVITNIVEIMKMCLVYVITNIVEIMKMCFYVITNIVEIMKDVFSLCYNKYSRNHEDVFSHKYSKIMKMCLVYVITNIEI